MSGPLVLLVVGAPLIALWIFALVEAARRADLSAARKLGWIAALLLLPVVGLAAYIVARPTRALYAERPTVDLSVAERLVRAAEQRQRGQLSAEEYRHEIDAIATFR